MIFDEKVVGLWGSGKKACAFQTMRHSLYQECVQDIIKLSFDKDLRTPSVSTIVDRIQVSVVLDRLREEYAAWHIPIDDQKDESLKNGLRIIQAREETERRKEFDRLHANILKRWEDFQSETWIDGFQTIRDKITAHLELKLINGKYQHIDIAKLCLKWGDVKKAIDSLEQIVLNLNMIVLKSSFDIKSALAYFERDSKAFWQSKSC